MLSFGSAIRRLRGDLTQKELARRLDVTETYISHLEADRREPSVKLVRTIAKEVNAPVGLLISILLLVELPKESRRAIEPILSRLIELTGNRYRE